MKHATFADAHAEAELQHEICIATIKVGLIFWAANFVLDSILWGLAGVDPIDSAFGKAIFYVCAAPVMLGASALFYRVRSIPIGWQALLAFSIAALCSPGFAWLALTIHRFCVAPQPVPFVWAEFGFNMVDTAGLMFSWCCLSVALIYRYQARDQERRLAASREEAMAAQMRALRYQINPHFLFNTLNSILSLVEERDNPRAERMLISLSAFLYETLRLNPLHDVRLEDEIALQVSYLTIERERFPDRITLTLAVDPALRDALVPTLILQPLVENAIKHGVGAGPGPVEIAIAAWREGEQLLLSVENDVPHADRSPSTRTGIGLRNVAGRLETRFGTATAFSAGLIDLGRFRASFALPWQTSSE